jgi:hypothetical protein
MTPLRIENITPLRTGNIFNQVLSQQPKWTGDQTTTLYNYYYPFYNQYRGDQLNIGLITAKNNNFTGPLNINFYWVNQNVIIKTDEIVTFFYTQPPNPGYGFASQDNNQVQNQPPNVKYIPPNPDDNLTKFCQWSFTYLNTNPATNPSRFTNGYLYEYERVLIQNGVITNNDERLQIIAQSETPNKNNYITTLPGPDLLFKIPNLQQQVTVQASFAWTFLHTNAIWTDYENNQSGNYIYKMIPLYIFNGYNNNNFFNVILDSIVMDSGTTRNDIIFAISRFPWILRNI